jgi:hypothetical protein
MPVQASDFDFLRPKVKREGLTDRHYPSGCFFYACIQAETNPCGSELARESGGTACIDAECQTEIASKLAPTGDPGRARNGGHKKSTPQG